MPAPELAGQLESGLVNRAISRVLLRSKAPSPADCEVYLRLRIAAENRIRLQYCEDGTTRAVDWHAHAAEHKWSRGGQPVSSREIFGAPPREDPDRPWGYGEKPMVAISWHDAQSMCRKLAAPGMAYGLPTEAEWEKAARGGLIGCPYPWGKQKPSPGTSDFDRFDRFSIQPMRKFAPNGYGLHAMSGCVWEWVADWYDAKYYASGAQKNPTGPDRGQEKVLRGGSWTDCAEATTVSFRMSHLVKDIQSGGGGSPNIGFRVCRKALSSRPNPAGGASML
jgi:formylglycine-generating enzyme required for sulfatase activity